MSVCLSALAGGRHGPVRHNASLRRGVSLPGRRQASRRHGARALRARHQPQRGRLRRVHDGRPAAAAARRHEDHQGPTTRRARQQGVPASAGRVRAHPWPARRPTDHRCKKRLLRFLVLSRFYVFNVFFNFPYFFK